MRPAFCPILAWPGWPAGLRPGRNNSNRRGQRIHAVVSLDTILRPAHLIPVYGDAMVPIDFRFMDCLDAFRAYYVNKYIDHHSHTIAF